MCHVKVASIEDGLIPSEKVVSITTVGGPAEIAVSGSLIKDNTLRAAFVTKNDNGHVLIELPCESTTGRRRVWVGSKEVVGI